MTKIFVVLILFVASLSHAKKTAGYLTYDEFQSMPEEQQLLYVDVLRHTLLNLSKNRYLMAETNSILEKVLMNVFPQATAADACDLKSASRLSNEDLLSKMYQTRNCYFLSDSGRQQRSLETLKRFGVTGVTMETIQENNVSSVSPSTANRIQVLNSEYNSRVKAGKINPNSPQADAASADLELAASDISQISQIGRTNFREMAESITNSRRAAAENPKYSEPEIERRLAVVKSTDQHQCISAGFVIPRNVQNKCQPYQVLPEGFAEGFFDQKTFRCASRKQILCNPLMFGYKESCDRNGTCRKTPICTARDPKSTETCYAQADMKNSLGQVLNIFQSANGKKIYDSFIMEMAEICSESNIQSRKDSQLVKDDIEDSCQFAINVFEILKVKKFLPYVRSKETQSTGGSAAKPSNSRQ